MSSGRSRRGLLITLALCMPLLLTGCGYRAPDLVDVGPSESAILLPLDGDTTKQQGFLSEELYKKNLVAAKRIEIPFRRYKTGVMPWNVRTIPTMRLIKVDRATVSREWTSGSDTGTNNANQSLRAESRDGIGITAGASCSAQIDEKDVPRFLYRYGGRSLSDIMDNELRTRVDQAFVEKCAKYNLSQLVQSKDEVMKYVKQSVEPYFYARGITVTALGLKGGFVYDQNVQQGFNSRAIATQELLAQRDRNTRILEAARAQSQAASLGQKSNSLSYQIRIRELDLREKQLDNQAKSIEAWKAGAPVPQAVGAGTIFSMPFQDNKLTPAPPPPAPQEPVTD